MNPKLHPAFADQIQALRTQYPSLTIGGSEQHRPAGHQYRINFGYHAFPSVDSGWHDSPAKAARFVNEVMGVKAK